MKLQSSIMPRIAVVDDPQNVANLPALADTRPLDAAAVRRDSPDVHWTLVDDWQQTLARCSLWWRRALPYQEHRVGVIGHFAACDGAAARTLLTHACEELQRRGCTFAVGPMDGDTWHNYRLVIDHGSEPPFFLEPVNPPDWPAHFLNSGFRILAEYFSAVNCDLAREAPWTHRVAEPLHAIGVRIRPLDPRQFERELRRIHAVATTSFQGNLLYRAISVDEFISLYRPLEQLVDPLFVLIAEHHERPVGFLFAVPDLCQAQRGERIGTLIVKTLAIQTGLGYSGLGYLLLEQVRQEAHEAGYTRLIHALVRDVAPLRRMTDKFARPMRRYAVFCQELGG